MALFSDGRVSTIEDLTAQDSQLNAVASVEGIDATVKLCLAYDQVSMELTALLTRLTVASESMWTTPVITLNNIVITPPLKLWHTGRTLDLFYGDAFFIQLNDRYQQKQAQFQSLASYAYQKLLDIGLGVVNSPVPLAPTPTLADLPGAGLPDGTYYVTAAWVGSNGAVGAAACPNAIATASASFTASLGPVPAGAAGWNVYAGVSADSLVQPGALVTTGAAPGNGQPPDFYQAIPRTMQRG